MDEPAGHKPAPEIPSAQNQKARLHGRHEHLLPELMLDVSREIGLDATLNFAKQFGGKAMTLSRHKGTKAHTILASAIGESAARKVAIRSHGVAITIPFCKSFLRAIRNDAIRSEFDHLTQVEKLSARTAVDKLAEKHAPIHGRSIWRLLNEAS